MLHDTTGFYKVRLERKLAQADAEAALEAALTGPHVESCASSDRRQRPPEVGARSSMVLYLVCVSSMVLCMILY